MRDHGLTQGHQGTKVGRSSGRECRMEDRRGLETARWKLPLRVNPTESNRIKPVCRFLARRALSFPRRFSTAGCRLGGLNLEAASRRAPEPGEFSEQTRRLGRGLRRHGDNSRAPEGFSCYQRFLFGCPVVHSSGSRTRSHAETDSYVQHEISESG